MQRIFENPHDIGAQIIAYKTFGTDNQIKTLFAGERIAVKLKAAEARKISVNHKTGTAAAVRTLSASPVFTAEAHAAFRSDLRQSLPLERFRILLINILYGVALLRF